MTETITLENELAIELDDDVETTLVITRDRLDDIQEWAKSREFDDEDMLDISREETFGKYTATREHFHGSEDDVSIRTDNSIVVFLFSDFLDL